MTKSEIIITKIKSNFMDGCLYDDNANAISINTLCAVTLFSEKKLRNKLKEIGWMEEGKTYPTKKSIDEGFTVKHGKATHMTMKGIRYILNNFDTLGMLEVHCQPEWMFEI
ncbi:hypothetical protein [Aeromonas hydrophila]|uniref:hypothetical protein n=1 Tax=Aeromonas hydrophila TaxID=644 RepID=UPI003D22F123